MNDTQSFTTRQTVALAKRCQNWDRGYAICSSELVSMTCNIFGLMLYLTTKKLHAEFVQILRLGCLEAGSVHTWDCFAITLCGHTDEQWERTFDCWTSPDTGRTTVNSSQLFCSFILILLQVSKHCCLPCLTHRAFDAPVISDLHLHSDSLGDWLATSSVDDKTLWTAAAVKSSTIFFSQLGFHDYNLTKLSHDHCYSWSWYMVCNRIWIPERIDFVVTQMTFDNHETISYPWHRMMLFSLSFQGLDARLCLGGAHQIQKNRVQGGHWRAFAILACTLVTLWLYQLCCQACQADELVLHLLLKHLWHDRLYLWFQVM